MPDSLLNRRTFACLALVAILAPTVRSQDSQRTPTPATADEVIVLSPFQVDARNDRGWLAANSLSASRTNVEIAKLPFGMSVLTSEFLNDLGVTDAVEAITRYTPGVTVGQFNELIIRGLPTRGFTFRDGMRTYTQRWSPGIDRIEVLRGPAGLLYGQTGPGGIVNYITKKPTFSNSFFAKATAGSFSLLRGDIDVNIAAPGDLRSKVGLRVNAAYEDTDGWQDRFYRKSDTVDAILSLQPFGDRVRLDLSYSRLHEDMFPSTGILISGTTTALQGGPYDWGINFIRPGVVVNAPREWNLFGKGSGWDLTLEYLTADLSVKVLDNLTFRAVYREHDEKRRSAFVGPSAGFNQSRTPYDAATRTGLLPAISAVGNGKPLINVGSTTGVTISPQSRKNPYEQYSLLWTPELLGTKHKVLAGYDTDESFNQQTNFNPRVSAGGANLSLPGSADIFRDYSSSSLPWDSSGNFLVSFAEASGNPMYSLGVGASSSKVESTSYYVADVITAFEDDLTVLVGARRGEFATTGLSGAGTPVLQPGGKSVSEASITTVQGGISYRIRGAVTPYYSYSESAFPITDVNPDGRVFDPQVGEGHDLGVKVSLLRGALQASIGVFQTDFNGTLIADPRDDPTRTDDPFQGYRIQVNSRTTKGSELDFLYQTNDLAWQFYAGISLYDSTNEDPGFLSGRESAMVSTPPGTFNPAAAGITPVTVNGANYYPVTFNGQTFLVTGGGVPVGAQSVPEHLRSYVREVTYTQEAFVKEKYSTYVKYTVRGGSLKGLSGRLGYTYSGLRHNVQSFGSRFYSLPGFGLVDAGISYGRRFGRAWWTLDLSVTNLTDKVYINTTNGAGYINWGSPRDLRVGSSIKF
jgi:iron complex outermembrane recepter protein